jgi:hypothetical protein
MSFKAESVSEDERISRFINERKKLTPSTGRARYNAFMPPRNAQMSVYRTILLSDEEVWQIGNAFVATADKPVIARADLSASVYFSNALTFDPDGIPHPRHANVVGWPGDETLQRLLAVQLAEAALLLYKPSAS